MSLHTTTSTNESQEEFSPTWLYIKQHNKTGLKYFGKTIKSDLDKYSGSGIRWLHHLKKHGYDTSTIWRQLFTDRAELIEFALTFSKENNIVESAEWANLMFEDGVNGGSPGRKASEETRAKFRARRHTDEFKKLQRARVTGTIKGPPSEETLQKMRKPKSTTENMKGPKSAEHCRNISLGKKGKPRKVSSPMSESQRAALRKPKPKVVCPHCLKEGGASIMKRWHFDHCKLRS